jgi:tetratricopeptide (TPR) repeat protein
MFKLNQSTLVIAIAISLVIGTPGNPLAIATIHHLPVSPASASFPSLAAAVSQTLKHCQQPLSSGDFQRAEAALRTSIQLNLTGTAAHHAWSSRLLMRHEIAAMITELRAALRANPNDAMAHAMLGQAFYDQGKIEVAIGELKQARDLFETQGNAQMTSVIDQFLHTLVHDHAPLPDTL